MLDSTTGHRILLVDDHDNFRESTAELLRLFGHDVLALASPLEALGALQRPNDVELLVTDVRMPHIDGLELARRVMAFRPEMPVLMVSSHSPSTAAVSLVAGFLLKPFSADVLQAEIERLLGQ